MRHAVRFSSIEGLFSQFKENMSAKCDLVAEKVQTILIIGYHIQIVSVHIVSAQ